MSPAVTSSAAPSASAAPVVIAGLAPVAAAPEGVADPALMAGLFEDVLRGVAGTTGLPLAADVAAAESAEATEPDDAGEPVVDAALLVPALAANAAALVLPAALSAAPRESAAPAGTAPAAGVALAPAGLPPGLAQLSTSLPTPLPMQAGERLAAPVPAATTAAPAPASAATPPLIAEPAAARPHAEPVPALAVAPSLAPAAAPAPAAEGVLALKASAPSQWRQPLQEALGDRLKLQLQGGSVQAVIRLDPPTLGRIEILVRHEAGNVHVHLSASNGEVLRQLGHIGDSLRQELVNRQQGEVSVVVSDASRDAEGRQRQRQGEPRQEAPTRALAEADEDTPAGRFAFAADRN